MRCFSSFSELIANSSSNASFPVNNDIADVQAAMGAANEQASVLGAMLDAYRSLGAAYYRAEQKPRMVETRDRSTKEIHELDQLCPMQIETVQGKIGEVNAAVSEEYKEIAELRKTDETQARIRLNNLLRLEKRIEKSMLGNRSLFGDSAFKRIDAPEELSDITPQPSVAKGKSTNPFAGQKFDSMADAEEYYKDIKNSCFKSFQQVYNAANFEEALTSIDGIFARKHIEDRTSGGDADYETHDIVSTEPLSRFRERWVAGGGDPGTAEYNYELAHPKYERGGLETEAAMLRAKETVQKCLSRVDFTDTDDVQELPVFLDEAAKSAGVSIDPASVSAAIEKQDIGAIKSLVDSTFVPPAQKPKRQRASGGTRQGPKYEYKFGVCVDGPMPLPNIGETLIQRAEKYASNADPDLYQTFSTLVKAVIQDERRHERLDEDLSAATSGAASSRFVDLDPNKPLAPQLHPELRGTVTADKLMRLDERRAAINDPERLHATVARFCEQARELQPDDRKKVYQFLKELDRDGVDIPGFPLDDLSIRKALSMNYTQEQKDELFKRYRQRA